MNWAFRRQFFYALAILIALGLVLTGVWFAFFYHVSTCSDGIQNQDEGGIDCGGSCTKLCTAPLVSALWARAVEAGPGVYHAVALVRNPETDAGTDALPYTFSLYDADNVLIAERSSTMYLAPGEVAPLFAGDIVTGNRIPMRAFVRFGTAIWQKMESEQNPIRVTSQNLDQEALRLTAHIENATAIIIPRATISALLYDAEGNLVNASQTTVSDFPARGEKDIVFTWQKPFSAPVVRFDVTPRVH
ncbi:MAG: hypothetical protein Q7R74_01765 [bacterium]|nr:hypothetical protein [bacterium]